jgi:hypothetical protein
LHPLIIGKILTVIWGLFVLFADAGLPAHCYDVLAFHAQQGRVFVKEESPIVIAMDDDQV